MTFFFSFSSFFLLLAVGGFAADAQSGPGAEKVDCWTCADEPLHEKLSETFIFEADGDSGNVPRCAKDDWSIVLGADVPDNDYYCAKVVAEGAIARGAVTRDMVRTKFNLTDPPEKQGCRSGVTHHSDGSAGKDFKGELCLCSTENCNNAYSSSLSFAVLGVCAFLSLSLRAF